MLKSNARSDFDSKVGEERLAMTRNSEEADESKRSGSAQGNSSRASRRRRQVNKGAEELGGGELTRCLGNRGGQETR